VSVNVISTINYHTDTGYFKKSIVAKGRRFSLYALKFIGISNHNNNNDDNSIQFVVYLRANLTSKRPIIKLARVRRNTQK
jgi:hypothetical protein